MMAPKRGSGNFNLLRFFPQAFPKKNRLRFLFSNAERVVASLRFHPEVVMKRLCLLVIAVLLSFCAGAFAQPKSRALDKETFMEMESVGNPEISPDGKQI